VRRAACAGNALGERDGVALSEALEVNVPLTKLDLSGAWQLPLPRVRRHPRLSVAVPWPRLWLAAGVA
jgi:hypothetical protein